MGQRTNLGGNLAAEVIVIQSQDGQVGHTTQIGNQGSAEVVMTHVQRDKRLELRQFVRDRPEE